MKNTGFPRRNHLAGLGGVTGSGEEREPLADGVPQLLWITLCMTALSIEKSPQWSVLSAVCLKNGHCAIVNRPTIFSGLTNIYLSFPLAIGVPLFCVNFLVERTIQLWGAS